MLLTFAVSGFASFALEIVWFRLLVVLLRPTTYAFTVMLATVLAGIAIGSWISTPLVTRQRPASNSQLSSGTLSRLRIRAWHFGQCDGG